MQQWFIVHTVNGSGQTTVAIDFGKLKDLRFVNAYGITKKSEDMGKLFCQEWKKWIILKI